MLNLWLCKGQINVENLPKKKKKKAIDSNEIAWLPVKSLKYIRTTTLVFLSLEQCRGLPDSVISAW